MAMLEVSHLEKHFGDTEVLKDINFSLDKGQSLAIIGSSGSGKTTLLRCLNFLERPDSGTIHVDGQLLLDGAVKTKTSDSEVRKKRLKFGLVFQNFNLFPQYTALENVMLASQLLSKERPDYKQRKKEILAEIRTNAEDLLTQVGLKDRMIPEYSKKRCPRPNGALKKDDRLKLKALGTSELSLNHDAVELRYLEQLRDSEQTMALAYLLKYLEISLMDGRRSMTELADLVEKQLDAQGLESLFPSRDVRSSLARPRRQEILACVNRYRKLNL